MTTRNTQAGIPNTAGCTSLGVGLRDHAWLSGTIVTAVWLLGTGYGLRLIRRAERANGACER